MSNYPFKFLDSYTKENRAFFFGRDEEINELYEMVFQTNMVFVYGPSGAGKTSLIQCGLASKFEDTDWFELFVRKGDNICKSTLQAIQKNIIASDEEDEFWEDEEDYEFQIPTFEAVEYTTNQQALVQLYNSNLKPIYIIYDQFEELYTLGDEAEQVAFIDLIKELEQVNIPCTFLFVMREEYLAALYDFEKAVPNLLKKKLRIEHTNFKKVNTIIRGITTSPLSIISLQGNIAEQEAIVETVFDKVREGKRTIQLPYLQIFMDRMYELVTGDVEKHRNKPVAFSLANVAAMKNIDVLLENFLETQIENVEQTLRSKGNAIPADYVMHVLSPLVTLDGTKEPLHKKDLIKKATENGFKPKLINETLSLLENSRILRYRSDEEVYEIAHDTLAKEIANKRSEDEKAFLKAKRLVNSRYADFENTKTLLNSHELAFIAPFKQQFTTLIDKSQLDFIKKSIRRKQRRRILTWSAVGGLLLAAFVVILIINNGLENAKNAELIANNAVIEANAAKDAAIEAKNEAIKSRKVAAKASIAKELEAEKAQKAQELAQEAQGIAEKNLKDLKRQQAISEANELIYFGDSYCNLHKEKHAKDSYKAALKVLKAYENIPLYQEISDKIKEGCL